MTRLLMAQNMVHSAAVTSLPATAILIIVAVFWMAAKILGIIRSVAHQPVSTQRVANSPHLLPSDKPDCNGGPLL